MTTPKKPFKLFRVSLHIRHKIFLALAIPFFALTISMIVMMKWSIQNGFKTYVAKVEMSKMDEFKKTLQEVYVLRGNTWGDFVGHKERWMHVYISSQFKGLPIPAPKGLETPKAHEFEKLDDFFKGMSEFHREVQLPPIEDLFSTFFNKKGHGNFPPPPRHHFAHKADKNDLRLPAIPPPIPGVTPFDILKRLSLFDQNGEPVVSGVEKAAIKSPIMLDGKAIGFLGLSPENKFTSEEDIEFIQEQLRVLYIMLPCLLVVALFLTSILTRHLVRPVTQIADCIRGLAEGKFTQRLAINSKDELEILANDINHLALTLEKNEHSRGRWIASVSHEIRTPLSILRGEIEAIQDNLRSADENAMSSLHEQVMGLNRLVEDLYSLSLSDIGELQYHIEPVPIFLLLANVIDAFQVKAKKSGVNIEKVFEISANAMIYGDSMRLQQLFSNLIENSLKYTDAPGVLKISAQQEEQHLNILFDDTAPSVNKSIVGQLFDYFFREDYLKHKAVGSSGIGLAICKNIVEAHKAQIEARESALGGLQVKLTFKTMELRNDS